MRAGAAVMNEHIIKRLQADTGGDQKLSGAKKGSKLGTTTRISPGTRIASALIAASPRKGAAQWSWLQKGTQAHDVGRRRDGKGGLHMRVNGGDFKTGAFRVSGSPAKRTFTEGADEGRKPTAEAMRDEIRKVWA